MEARLRLPVPPPKKLVVEEFPNYVTFYLNLVFHILRKLNMIRLKELLNLMITKCFNIVNIFILFLDHMRK